MDERTGPERAAAGDRPAAPERPHERSERPLRRPAPPVRKRHRRPGSDVTDPVGDLLTRLRNASRARHDAVTIPASRLKVEITKVLKAEGFIGGFDVERGDLTVRLKYVGDRGIAAITDVQRVSTPGRRVYASRRELPRVRAGLGIVVVSTSQGVMSGREAARKGLGGEVLCAAW